MLGKYQLSHFKMRTCSQMPTKKKKRFVVAKSAIADPV